jgi:hypothetical protein
VSRSPKSSNLWSRVSIAKSILRQFADMEKGMTTSWEMLNQEKLDENYTYPGGLLWTGEELVLDKPVVLG